MGITQAELARRAAVGLKFLYELESGKDTLRADKVLDVLDALKLELVVGPRPATQAREPRAHYAAAPAATDYIGMACSSAGVSLREPLAADELVRALLTGEPPTGKHAHFIVLLEEAPAELLRGLVGQVEGWAKPGAVRKNVEKIATCVGLGRRGSAWRKKLA